MVKTLQDQLLDAILVQFPKRSTAVEALSKMLGIGKDAVYRRLRGDTLLTPNEVRQLAQTFKISLDALVFDDSEMFIMAYGFAKKPVSDFQTFLKVTHHQLEQIASLADIRIQFAVSDIPFFYYGFFPELAAFKLYIWGKTVWSFNHLQDRKFDLNLLADVDRQWIEKLRDLYNTLPSTEHWSWNILDLTLRQIEFYLLNDDFEQTSDAFLLCDRLMELIQHLEHMAQYGRKFMVNTPPENALVDGFELYLNELVNDNPTILVLAEKEKILFTSYHQPHFLKTTDSQMCQTSENWFRQLEAKSKQISKDAQKKRAWFFKVLKEQIEQTKRRMTQHLND